MEYLNIVTERWISLITHAVLILGSMYFVFWILKPKWIQHFRIQQPREENILWKEELPRSVWGLSASMISVLINVYLIREYYYTAKYWKIEEYGIPYLIASIFIFIIVIDAWFYWSHRLLHKVRFLKKSHDVHHRSYNITPLSSYSFDIVEAIINVIPFWILTTLLPWHAMALQTVTLVWIFYLGYLHLGYDFAYSYRTENPILRWFNTSTHHAIHHQRNDGNFGLYFTFWDRLMKTEIMKENK